MLYVSSVADGKGTQGIITITITDLYTKSDAANKARYLNKRK